MPFRIHVCQSVTQFTRWTNAQLLQFIEHMCLPKHFDVIFFVQKNDKVSTVEPRFLDNAINGYPPLMDNKLRSQIFLAFCNAKLPLDNGHAFSGESPISVKYFMPKWP